MLGKKYNYKRDASNSGRSSFKYEPIYKDDELVDDVAALKEYYEKKKQSQQTVQLNNSNAYTPLVKQPSLNTPPPVVYKPPPTEAELAEQEFWNGFEPGYVVVFCFRRPCEKTNRNCLNKFALMASNYIHVEVCIYNREGNMTRSLFITEQTKTVKFATNELNDIDPKTGSRLWDFIWVRLDNEDQVSKMKRSIYQLVGLYRPQRFSSCNIYCFYCFAMPCLPCCCCVGKRPKTTTCTRTTMEFIRDVWRDKNFTISRNLFSYTPDDVYEFIINHNGSINILQDFEKFNPTKTVLA
jgi:hypothetical protein